MGSMAQESCPVASCPRPSRTWPGMAETEAGRSESSSADTLLLVADEVPVPLQASSCRGRSCTTDCLAGRLGSRPLGRRRACSRRASRPGGPQAGAGEQGRWVLVRRCVAADAALRGPDDPRRCLIRAPAGVWCCLQGWWRSWPLGGG